MWIIVLEALLALAVLVFIVAWTFWPTQRRERDERRALADKNRDEER